MMVYIFLAEGFEEVEAITPIDILRRGNIPVTLVGVTGKSVCGAHKIEFSCDKTIDEIDIKDADAVVLPGGMPGTKNLQNDNRVLDAVRYAAKNNLIVAAICAAPSVVGSLGLLDGKCATCYPGFEDKLTGAKVKAKKCVVDGNFITARGPGAAAEFGFTLLSALTGDNKATRKLQDDMIF